MAINFELYAAQNVEFADVATANDRGTKTELQIH